MERLSASTSLTTVEKVGPSSEASAASRSWGRPAFALLTSNERFGRLALSMERIKVLLQPFFRRLACVDGAVDFLRHAEGSFFRPLNPKKAGPDHRVPVISRAISERLAKVRLLYS